MQNFKKRCGGQIIEFVIAACVIIIVIFVCLNIFDVNLSSVFKADNGSSRLANLFGNSNSRTSADSMTDPSKTFQANSDFQSAINESTKTTGSKSQLSFYNSTMDSLINKTAGLLGDGSDSANALKKYLESTSSLTNLNGTNATNDAVNKAKLLEKAIDINKKGADAGALQAALDAYMKDHPNDTAVQKNISYIMAMGTALDYSVDASFDTELNKYLTNNEAIKNQLIAAQLDKVQKDLKIPDDSSAASSYSSFINTKMGQFNDLVDLVRTAIDRKDKLVNPNQIIDQFNLIFGNSAVQSAPTPSESINNLQACFSNSGCTPQSQEVQYQSIMSDSDSASIKSQINDINNAAQAFISWLSASTQNAKDKLKDQINGYINDIARTQRDTNSSVWAITHTAAINETIVDKTNYISQQMATLNSLVCTQRCNSKQKRANKDIATLQNLINGDTSSFASIDTKAKISMIMGNADINKSFASSQDGQKLLNKINVYFVNNYSEIMNSQNK